jgi:hypothetical protein
MLDYSGLNYLAIIVVTLLGFVLGGLWYSPFLLGRSWLAALGKTEKDIPPSAIPFIITLAASFLTAHTLALFINTLAVTTIGGAVTLSLYVGISFVMANMASDFAFCRWPARLFWIMGLFRLILVLVMGIVLVLWR